MAAKNKDRLFSLFSSTTKTKAVPRKLGLVRNWEEKEAEEEEEEEEKEEDETNEEKGEGRKRKTETF